MVHQYSAKRGAIGEKKWELLSARRKLSSNVPWWLNVKGRTDRKHTHICISVCTHVNKQLSVTHLCVSDPVS